MTSAKGILLSAVGRWALREARVASVRELGERMRALSLEGDALRGVGWVPGDKLQILLPSRDVRTYTPATWDAQRGTTELVLFAHGESPGARWIRDVEVGHPCRFVGPQRSLRRRGNGPAVVFGDETSLGLAVALGGAAVLEVGSVASTRAVVAALGLAPGAEVALVGRTAGDAHLGEVARELARLARARPGAELVLTGRAQSIQALRPRLRAAGADGRTSNKPYWAEGKVGLD